MYIKYFHIFYLSLFEEKEKTISEKREFLNEVYKYKSDNETKFLYKNWAELYEDELIKNDYMTPSRCADALNRHLQNKRSNILDIGCGSGLSGEALYKLGYRVIDGSDFSPEMLKLAEKKYL